LSWKHRLQGSWFDLVVGAQGALGALETFAIAMEAYGRTSSKVKHSPSLDVNQVQPGSSAALKQSLATASSSHCFANPHNRDDDDDDDDDDNDDDTTEAPACVVTQANGKDSNKRQRQRSTHKASSLGTPPCKKPKPGKIHMTTTKSEIPPGTRYALHLGMLLNILC
jgi:hypothetical protein